MSSRNPLESQVEHIVRTSEILAVARALESGAGPRVGQSIDYYIEPEASGLVTVGSSAAKRGRPYRTAIEQWHLDAARQMLRKPERTKA